MKRFALALCLSALAAGAQAQTGDQRAPHASRLAASSQQAQLPTPVAKLLKWLREKSQPAKTARKTKPTAPKVAEQPKSAPAEVA